MVTHFIHEDKTWLIKSDRMKDFESFIEMNTDIFNVVISNDIKLQKIGIE